jgi:hypothetical protein
MTRKLKNNPYGESFLSKNVGVVDPGDRRAERKL